MKQVKSKSKSKVNTSIDDLTKYAFGGDINNDGDQPPSKSKSVSLPNNLYDILQPQQQQPVSTLQYYRPSPFLPQNNTLKLKDNRKINATSGKPINPNKDLVSGTYDINRINNIVHYAKLYNLDPYNLLSMDLQETSLGNSQKDLSNHNNIIIPPGHVLMGDGDIKTPSKVSEQAFNDVNINHTIDINQYNDILGYDNFARVAKDKINYAKSLGLDSEIQQLQAYNGFGKVFPSTEENYNGFKMKQIYGVDVPSTGINMKQNPLYGKRILDLKNNVIKQNPQFRDAVENTFALGGEVKPMKTNKTKKTLDDLGKYPFGTGFQTQAAEAAGGILSTQALNGLLQIFNPHSGNADGNMFNLPQEGQIMATGGFVEPPIVLPKFKLPNTKIDFNALDAEIPAQYNYEIAPANDSHGNPTYLKSNGGIGQWGNPIDPTPNPVLPGKPIISPANFNPISYQSMQVGRNQERNPSPATVHSNTFAMGGTIKIKPSHKGRFTAWAKEHHMSVSEAASHVMANKSKYSSHVVKMANFAHNFAAMGDSSLQPLQNPSQQGGGNVPVEVEGGEVAQTPNGQIGQFSGPTHEDGGIPTNLPQGTKIYSNRLGIDGKSMQERKLKRERQIGKLNNMLDKDPTDTINRNTYNRSRAAAEMEEQQDLMMQDAANQIYQKVPQLQDASSGFQTPMEGQQEQQQQLGDMGQVQGTGVPKFAGGTGDGGVTDPYGWNQFAVNVMKPWAPNPLDMSQATPNIPVVKPSYNAMTYLDEPNPNFNKTPSTDMPYSSGDKLGFLGNAVDAVAPLATTIANRAGDKPNVNAFQNFGKNAIDANDRGMGFMGVVRDEALKNADLMATTQRTRNRNSASSVNTARALDLATTAGQDTTNNGIYSNYASQMAGMYNERSKLSNQQDLYHDTGAQTADRMDRMDRDNYYSNLGQNLTNIGKQAQTTAKEMNEHEYNNQLLHIMPYLNKYGLGFTYDENGHISGMSKIAS